jgi:Ca2+/H+ antiporter
MSKLLTPENILNLLLIFVPIAIVLEVMHASATLIFITSCLAIIPLAGSWAKPPSTSRRRWAKASGAC